MPLRGFIPGTSAFTGILFLFAFWLLPAGSASAHATGETYVWLNVEESNFTGRVEINLKDLREKLGINVPDSGEGRTEILREHREQVLSYIREHFSVDADGTKIRVEYTDIGVLDLTAEEGNYAQYFYTTPDGTVPDIVTIHNSLFVDDDILHRSLLCLERNRKTGEKYEGEFAALVFSADNATQELDLTNIEMLLRPRDFIWQGVLHIWIGVDHILFIITLLLPAVLVFREAQWKPVPEFRTAFWNIVRIVTIFTVAHSITLSLAALGLVRLPSRLVESVIALSIVLVALNTISPKFRDKTWMVIFGFGLFHGLGFASVMSDLPFRMVHLVKVLIGFNIGVELGQLAIVAAVFPVIFLLRKAQLYNPLILRGGSLITASIACYWFVERAFAL